jgi:L-rhamnose mutarotase
MKRYCLALDLKDDPELIRGYEDYHRSVWPEVLGSIRKSGIEQMEIYRTDNRLFMVVDALDHFSFETKQTMDEANEKVSDWERLMWKYQQALPGAKEGEKWRVMHKIFDLRETNTFQ